MGLDTTRVQLELPVRAYERLAALKHQTEAASYAEVIRNALRVYEHLAAQTQAGRTLYLRNPDGTFVEILFV